MTLIRINGDLTLLVNENVALSPYQYEPLPPRHIRLIILLPGPKDSRINIDLTAISLDDEVDDGYMALSYTWGTDRSQVEISCSGGGIGVTVNLHDALQTLRHESEVKVIWIDQISINQQDLGERCEQVKLMAEIYSRASRAMVWLGKEIWENKNFGQDYMRLCEVFNDQITSLNSGPRHLSLEALSGQDAYQDALLAVPRNVWDSLVSILRNSYFRRVWIIQEVIKSKSSWIMCGGLSCEWRTIEVINMFLQSTSIPSGLLPPDLRPATRCVMKINTIRARLKHPEKDWFGRARWTLLDLVLKTWNFMATDSRDKIYGVAGLLDSVHCVPQDVTPDYEANFLEVLTDVFIHGMTQQSALQSLSYCYPKSRHDLPSWLPDPTKHIGVPYELCKLYDHYRAAGSTSSSVLSINDRQGLVFKVRIVGTVGALSSDTSISREEKLSYFDSSYTFLNTPSTLNTLLESIDDYRKLTFGEMFQDISHDDLDNFIKAILCDMSLNKTGRSEDGERNMVLKFCMRELSDDEKDEIPGLISEMASLTADLRFCTLKKTKSDNLGRTQPLYGWVPPEALVGDFVCIVHGFQVPMLLRQGTDGNYRFMGITYIQGIMDGEAMSREGLNDEYLVIH